MEWSVMPFDLLRFVAKKVSDPADFVHFRAVCKNWCAAVSPSDAPTFRPWLFRITLRGADSISFYSPAAGAARAVRVPQLRDMLVAATSGGFLFAVGSILFNDIVVPAMLLNPLTGSRIDLPNIQSASDPDVRVFSGDGGWTVRSEPPNLAWMGSFAARLFLVNGRWTVGAMVICHAKFDLIAVCRPGDPSWRFVRLPFNVKHVMHSRGIILVGDRERLWLLNGATLEFLGELLLPGGAGDSYRFLEAPVGMLCAVIDRKRYSEMCLPRIRRLEYRAGEQPRWTPVDGLGDGALFFGCREAVVLPAGSGVNVEGGIFWYQEWEDGRKGSFIRAKSLLHHHHGSHVEELHCPMEAVDSWFTPSLC